MTSSALAPRPRDPPRLSLLVRRLGTLMFTRTSTLRAVMRANERREEALLALIRNLGDRLANAHGQPWTLPPRPSAEPKEESEFERLYRETISL